MRWVSKILLILYVVAAFKNGAILVFFEMNREEIVAEKCVERKLEVNTCQGKCHLKAMLEEVDKESQDEEQTFTFKYEVEDNVIPALLSLSIDQKQFTRVNFPENPIGLVEVYDFPDSPPPKV